MNEQKVLAAREALARGLYDDERILSIAIDRAIDDVLNATPIPFYDDFED